ncbi:MAG: hypothetical protein HXX09_14800 [Bacteroidetes bacterium]|nr:hypothetical protein [Bacteroidota bacterium]
MQTKTKFIIFIVLVVVIIGGLGTYFALKPQAPGKLDQFAQALSQKAKFYGAFWCTHCQAQKAEFGSSKKYLPYVECSNPDNTQTQICKDNKIEGYPTWMFQDGVKITSKSAPLVCAIKTATSVEPDACAGRSSEYYQTWIFDGYNFSIKSPTAPVQEGDVWKFPSTAQVTGENPLNFLAEQIGFVLPQ